MVIAAISITEDVQTILRENHGLRILHCFEQVWNLIDEQNRVLSVVSHKVGNSPLNLVVDGDYLPRLDADSTIFCTPLQISTAQHKIDVRSASIWNATLPSQSASQICTIARHCIDLLAKFDNHSLFAKQGRTRLEQIMQAQLIQGADAMIRALKSQKEAELSDAVLRLAGQGIGLTPSGDDWLMGCMLALYQFGYANDAQQIANCAAKNTSPFSACLLQMAGEGKASDLWHKLLTAEWSLEIETAILNILAYGYSSGADALYGFVAVSNWHMASAFFI